MYYANITDDFKKGYWGSKDNYHPVNILFNDGPVFVQVPMWFQKRI